MLQVSSWSRRWFTHIFLFVIVLLYSIAGAMIFVTVEGTHEELLHFNIRKERYVADVQKKIYNYQEKRKNNKIVLLQSKRTQKPKIKLEDKLLYYFLI